MWAFVTDNRHECRLPLVIHMTREPRKHLDIVLARLARLAAFARAAEEFTLSRGTTETTDATCYVLATAVDGKILVHPAIVITKTTENP
jgi:hypothetical protein